MPLGRGLNSVSDQMQKLPNYFTTPNKMTVETTLRGWCLYCKVPSSMSSSVRELESTATKLPFGQIFVFPSFFEVFC